MSHRPPPSAARNALVVSGAALMAYSCDVAGHRPFVLTGEVVQGLPAVRAPPFSVTTANGTVSFTQMVQVGREGARPLAWAAGASGPDLSPEGTRWWQGALSLARLPGPREGVSGGRDRQGRIPDRAPPQGLTLVFLPRAHGSRVCCVRTWRVPAHSPVAECVCLLCLWEAGVCSGFTEQHSKIPRPPPQAKPHETKTTKR